MCPSYALVFSSFPSPGLGTAIREALLRPRADMLSLARTPAYEFLLIGCDPPNQSRSLLAVSGPRPAPVERVIHEATGREAVCEREFSGMRAKQSFWDMQPQAELGTEGMGRAGSPILRPAK